VILVGSFGSLFGMRYGQLLLVKIGLFLAMVALAGANRFLLVPSLSNESERGKALSHLRGHVLLEQILGVAVLAIVSGLGTMAPPAMPT
jgi:putative copper resistance protein D